MRMRITTVTDVAYDQQTISSLLLTLFLVVGVPPDRLVGQTADPGKAAQDEALINEVLDIYVSAWREGDVERLSEIFAAEEGRVMWLTGNGADQHLASMTFQQVLDRGSRPNPEYGLEWDVLSLDVLDGALAMAKLDISRSGGSYVDYLALQKIAGEWRIVNKTFVVR